MITSLALDPMEKKPLSRFLDVYKRQEIVPYDTYYCADDFIAVGINDESMWPDFCEAIEMPELEKDPRYATNDLRCENFESFTALMRDCFKDKELSLIHI